MVLGVAKATQAYRSRATGFRRDLPFYDLLALVDVLRLGRARERKMAEVAAQLDPLELIGENAHAKFKLCSASRRTASISLKGSGSLRNIGRIAS